jgi:hypothetical protein
MAYFNSVTNDVIMKERQQAFQREADMRQLVRLADAQQSQPKANVLTALRKRIAKVIWLQQPDANVNCEA